MPYHLGADTEHAERIDAEMLVESAVLEREQQLQIRRIDVARIDR